jgi:hypothetical protein
MNHCPCVSLHMLQIMRPHTRTAHTAEMCRVRLCDLFNMKPPLVLLAGLMGWEFIEHHFAGHFTFGRGLLGVPINIVLDDDLATQSNFGPFERFRTEAEASCPTSVQVERQTLSPRRT